MYTVRFLEELTSAQKDRTGDICQFVCTFTAVSTRLRRTEILSEYQEIQLFLGGLHLNIARKLVTTFKLDVNASESFQGKFHLIPREAQDYCIGAIRTEELIQKGEFLPQRLIEQILEQRVEQPRPALPVARSTQRLARDPDLLLAIDAISKHMEAMALHQQIQFLEELRRANQRQPQVYVTPAPGANQRQPQAFGAPAFGAPASGANSTPLPGT
jgi:hypothetical protein